jgi:hypothetical protein
MRPKIKPAIAVQSSSLNGARSDFDVLPDGTELDLPMISRPRMRVKRLLIR